METEEKQEVEDFVDELDTRLTIIEDDCESLKDLFEDLFQKQLLLEAKIDAIAEVLIGNAILAQNEIDTLTQDNLQALYSELVLKN